jgi:hypothetical protein
MTNSQGATSPNDEPGPEETTLRTSDHLTIRLWAEERGGGPATVAGTEHGDLLGALRIRFAEDGDELRRVIWDDWFETFDERRLIFVYEDTQADGTQSDYYRLEGPGGEEA